MAGRPKIRRRKRLFVGCEGESEQGYVALLRHFAEKQHVAVHAETKVITRAGDPLALVQRAIAMAEQGERGSKPAYIKRFLLMDTDLIGQNPERDAKVSGLANHHEFVLVKQDCCFEAFLLRHIDGHANDEPPTAAIALDRLQAIWPEYKKGLPSQELRKRIAIEDVLRALQNPRNADFISLVGALGLSLD